jgi:thymidylate synthase
MIMNAEQQYLQILEDLINSEVKQKNRTGVDTYKVPPRMIQHDMSRGFPLLTTKKVAWKTMKVELEGFIKGITSKKWFQDRGCHIWDEWCNPQKVPYGNNEEAKAKMRAEDDLGPCIYGASWRNFHDPEAFVIKSIGNTIGLFGDSIKHVGQNIDQLKNIVDTLHNNPEDRRMICLAWNPLGLKHTALPSCHYSWQVLKRGDYLDLVWTQRSCDHFLGIPFNIASYGLLLHILAKEANLKEGVLSGSLADLHLYENHVEQAREQLSRKPYQLPIIKTENFESIFDWEHGDTELIDYKYHPTIKAPVAV